MSFSLASTALKPNGIIPAYFTCDGAGISPPLNWCDVPPNTQSLALIIDDPDAPDPGAPARTWVHWLVYNIPPTIDGLAEGAAGQGLLAQIKQGINDWQRREYGGPCPPRGRHRYFHKLYALDTVLPELSVPTKTNLERAMRGHVLAQTELVATYERKLKPHDRRARAKLD